MTETGTLYNTVAPLANVARLAALIKRTQDRAHGLPGMSCFFGRAGSGKTTAGIYCTNTLQACHVEALPVGGTKKLLEMIVAEMGLKPKRLVTDLFDQAAHELTVTNRPLLIDEADQILTDRMIETVRHLHDKSGAPVILMGEELLPQRLQHWPRVHGRMLAWVEAEAATIDDVNHLARIYAPRVEVTQELREKVLTASKASMRYISTNLAAIAEFAAVRGLTRIGTSEFGATAFHTGEPPVLRRGAVLPAARKGKAA